MGEKQQGASVTFGTSAGTWGFLNIGRFSAPIPVIDDTHLGTTARRQAIAGDLEDPQMVTLTLMNKGNQAYPLRGLVQTITITNPIGSYTVSEKLIGSGFVVDVRTSEFQSNSEGLQTIEIDIKFNGVTGPARTIAS